MKPIVTLSKIEHNNQERIALVFEKDSDLISRVKQLDGRQWSSTRCLWHVPYSKESYKNITTKLGEIAEIRIENVSQNTVKQDNTKNTKEQVEPKQKKDTTPTPFVPQVEANKDILRNYIETLKIKKYAESTIQTYFPIFIDFVKYFDRLEKSIDTLFYNEIFDYIKENTKELGLSEFKQFISAIKFYYEKIPDKEKMYFNRVNRFDIKSMPVRFDFETITQIAGKHIPVEGHRLILYFAFFLGLPPVKISELTLNSEEILQKFDNYRQNPIARDTINMLIIKHKEKYNNKQY